MSKEKYDLLRVKELASLKEISISELAKQTGISYTYMSEISRNVKFPRPEYLVKIANVLNVDIRELFVSTKEDKTNTELLEEIESITGKLKSRLSDET